MTRGSGLRRTISEMQFVSSKKPVIARCHAPHLYPAPSPIRCRRAAILGRTAEILWLMGLADEPLVLLIGDHDHALLVPAGDQLRSLGAGAAKEFAKARLGGLQLPAGLRGGFSGSCALCCARW